MKEKFTDDGMYLAINRLLSLEHDRYHCSSFKKYGYQSISIILLLSSYLRFLNLRCCTDVEEWCNTSDITRILVTDIQISAFANTHCCVRKSQRIWIAIPYTSSFAIIPSPTSSIISDSDIGVWDHPVRKSPTVSLLWECSISNV